MTLTLPTRTPAINYDEYLMAFQWRQQLAHDQIPDDLGLSLLQAAYIAACEHGLTSLKPSIVRNGRPPRSVVVSLAVVEGAREGIFDTEKVLGPQRTRPITRARFRSWRRLRALGYSLPGIGFAYRKDHTTILNGLRSIIKVDAPVNSAEEGR